MLRPTQLALDHLTEFQRTGKVDLGTAAVERRDYGDTQVMFLRLLNPR